MEVNRLELLDALKFIKSAIGNNDSRRNLMCVNAVFKKNEVILTASNSFIIKRERVFGVCDITVNLDETINIIRSEALDMISILEMHKGLKNNRYETVTFSPNWFQSKQTAIDFTVPDFVYPNLERLFSPSGNGCKHFALTPTILKDAISGFGMQKNRPHVLEITCLKEDGPILIEQHHTTKQAVIMTVRLNHWMGDETND